jgi:hypothetical protein
MIINASLRFYAGLCRVAIGEVGDASANEGDYRSKIAIFCKCASLGDFEGGWGSWYATQAMEFCMIFLVQSLRFAELVQAGEILC